MKVEVKRFKNLTIGLKELEPFIKDGHHLRSGRPFKSLGLRSRETLANCLLCAVGNFESGTERLTFSSDPLGGDGIISDSDAGTTMFTEHMYVPTSCAGDLETLISEAVAHKQKKGTAYARGKVLIIMSDAVGSWFPTRAAKQLAGSHDFDEVWVIHLESAKGSRYIYCVTRLDIDWGTGNAPAWRVLIGEDFETWRVEHIQ